MMNMKDKVALVTGASKGIGRAAALALAREGCRVALFARSGRLLDTLKSDIEDRFNGQAISVPGDIRKEEDIKTCVRKTLEAFGDLHILINNAGLGHFHDVADLPTGSWDEMFDVNVRGQFLFTRESLPALRDGGGAFVAFVVSVAGKNAFPTGGGYAATKHALLAFARCLMLEERKNGIRVLALCPGSVDTEFSLPGSPPGDPHRERILKAEDVAEAIVSALRQPRRAMISEIDIRPTNP
jgi:3-oxoacyl-[acyl-carrier protein] reductase